MSTAEKCPVDHILLADQQKVQAIARDGIGSKPADSGVQPHKAAGVSSQYGLDWPLKCIMMPPSLQDPVITS